MTPMDQETTQDFPFVMIAVDGSNRIYVFRDEVGDKYYFTPIAGWRKWPHVPVKDLPPDPATFRDRFVYHDDRWWPDAQAALLMVKAIGKYL